MPLGKPTVNFDEKIDADELAKLTPAKRVNVRLPFVIFEDRDGDGVYIRIVCRPAERQHERYIAEVRDGKDAMGATRWKAFEMSPHDHGGHARRLFRAMCAACEKIARAGTVPIHKS